VYAEFDIPADALRTDPPSIAGGDAVIELDTASNGAGCVVFVSDGLLRTFAKALHTMESGRRQRE